MRRSVVPALFLVAAAVTGAHAWHAVLSAGGHPDDRHILLALYALLRAGVALAFAAFTFGRAEPHRRTREPLAFLACGVALLAFVGIAGPTRGADTLLLAIGDAVAICGCIWQLASVLALGRCFGVLPEARGLVQRGPYRVVRHPVYLGEITALAGLTLPAPTSANLAMLAIFAAAQMARARYEERALSDAFPEYARYVETTGRLLPSLRRRAVTPVAADGTPSPLAGPATP